MSVITNPILSGFYPDPSVCRVGDDFYLVNSSFAYFPGIPVFHSVDLVHWEQIGNALDRPEQLPLDGARTSRGLFAPSIRYHAGTFYLVCTNVDNGGNFIMTATDAAGPWSNPVWLPAPGIDPSVFFDDDGSAWYVGTRPAPEGCAYSGNWEAWTQRLDLDAVHRAAAAATSGIAPGARAGDNGKACLVGETYGLWRGALRECVWPEGPHLYRINGWYYLMIAEGGTGPDHAVSVARSKTLTGPYEGKKSNPILTHRHLGARADVVNVGHADLFDDPTGGWWMVCLASRPYGPEGRRVSNLGRETFLVPVRWEDEWPLASPDTGLVEPTYPAPELPAARSSVGGRALARLGAPACDHFDAQGLPQHWISLRLPGDGAYSLSARPGFLRLFAQPGTLRETVPVSFLGRRQTDRSWAVSCAIEFAPSGAASAGIALLQSEAFQYRFEVCAIEGVPTLRVVRAAGAADEVVASRAVSSFVSAPVPGASVKLTLAVLADEQDLAFYAGADWESLVVVAEGVDGSILSTERAGGFVGTVLGLFASGNGVASGHAVVANGTPAPAHADFDWFAYEGR